MDADRAKKKVKKVREDLTRPQSEIYYLLQPCRLLRFYDWWSTILALKKSKAQIYLQWSVTWVCKDSPIALLRQVWPRRCTVFRVEQGLSSLRAFCCRNTVWDRRRDSWAGKPDSYWYHWQHWVMWSGLPEVGDPVIAQLEFILWGRYLTRYW